MRKMLASVLIAAGVIIAGVNGYNWISQASSGEEMTADDLMTVSAENNVPDMATEENNQQQEEMPDSSKEVPEEEEAENDVKEEPAEPPEPRSYDEYEKGEEIGTLLIPDIDMKYPIYWGTDEDTLTQGVGYHEGDYTTPPDSMKHTVLSGHRDTVFRELGDLEDGAKMYVQFEDVQYEYEIQKTWITDAEDRTVIVSKDEPVLTLTTCYPFNFIGAAPDRYIIEAPLTNVTEIE